MTSTENQYVVVAEISYPKGEFNTLYWLGDGAAWSHTPAGAATFPTRRKAWAMLSAHYAKPDQRRKHARTYAVGEYDENTRTVTNIKESEDDSA